MNLHAIARQLPQRLAAGTYLLDSGLSPLTADVWLPGIGTSLIVEDLVSKNGVEGRRS